MFCSEFFSETFFLKIFCNVGSHTDIYNPFLKTVEKDLTEQLEKARITQVNVTAVSPLELSGFALSDDTLENNRAKALNSILKEKSSDAALILLVSEQLEYLVNEWW